MYGCLVQPYCLGWFNTQGLGVEVIEVEAFIMSVLLER